MGSFSIKCFISNQVIAERERCRIAVIVQQASCSPVKVLFNNKEQELYGLRSHASDATCNWAPITGFLSGCYADYGLVELDNNLANRAILADFYNTLNRQAAVSMASGHEPEFNFQAFTVEHAPKLHASFAAQEHFLDSLPADNLDMAEALALWRALQDSIRQERVFYANSQVLRPLKMATMHEVSYQRLVALAENFTWRSSESYARDTYFQQAFSGLEAKLADVPENLKCFVRKDLIRESLRLRMCSSDTHAVLWAFRRELDAALAAVVDEGQPVSSFLDVCKEPLDMLYALAGIFVLNVQFAPIVYSGQDYENVSGRLYADFVNGASTEICIARKARYSDMD